MPPGWFHVWSVPEGELRWLPPGLPLLIGGCGGGMAAVLLPFHPRSMTYEAERFVPLTAKRVSHRGLVLRVLSRAAALHGWDALRLIRAASDWQGHGPFEATIVAAAAMELDALGT